MFSSAQHCEDSVVVVLVLSHLSVGELLAGEHGDSDGFVVACSIVRRAWRWCWC